MPGDDPKPTTAEDAKPEDPEKITIKVRDHAVETGVLQFTLRSNTPLKKLMDSYISRMNVDNRTCVFLFDGHRIKDDDTPKSLDMEDEDVVDAMLHQQGGAK